MHIGAIIAYHPIIFSGMTRMDPSERVPRIVMRYSHLLFVMQMYQE